MRTIYGLGALALSLTLCAPAHADDTKGVLNVQVGQALPSAQLLDKDGELYFLNLTVEDDQATVIKFFDPNEDPTHLPGAKADVKANPFLELYAKFKDQDVNWVFVAIGETTEVQKLAEAERGTAGEEAHEKVTANLAAARALQFAEFVKRIDKRGITRYELYVAPEGKIDVAKGHAPCVAITRGKRWVSHLAKAADGLAVGELTSELYLAVNRPEDSGEPGSLPASTPRQRD